MVYSIECRYRGSYGKLTLTSESLSFSRQDGFFSKTDRLMISIPIDAIISVDIDGMIAKKVVVIVDKSKFQGIPRHEFETKNSSQLLIQIQNKLNECKNNKSHPAKEVHIKEVISTVKIPCPYCGTLNEITEKNCAGCGSPIGKN